jgi:outer membrane biosynthesis protein TonB
MADRNRTGQGLPWVEERGEGQRFYLALVLMVVVFLPPALMIPALNLPEPERSEAEEVPPQLARLIEEKALPEPEFPQIPEPESEPEPVPEPPAQQPEPVPEKPAEVAQTPEPENPEPTPEQAVEKAREKASRSGLLAMKDTLATMRSSEPAARETLSANVADSDAVADKKTVDEQAALAGSGGVQQEQGMTRDLAVADHNVRQVEVAEEQSGSPEPPQEQQVASTGGSTRSMTNIKKVFDANKTSLNAMVGREQRKDPLLQGKVLLKLVIEPDGSVSSCEVVESELDNPQLEQRIAMRVRLFNFGAANVEQRELNFPLDFLPG